MVTPNHCSVLFPLQKVEVDMIRYLKSSIKSEDYNDFHKKYGHSKDAKISDVLWLCTSLISQSGVKVRNISVAWFTDNDLPHQVGSIEFKEAIEKTKDILNYQPDFQIFPLKEDFDGDLFYKDFMSKILEQDSSEIEFPSAIFDVKKIVKLLLRRDFRRRALAYVSVEISEKAKFGVGIYGFMRSHSEPKPVIVSRVTKQVISTTRTFKYGYVPDQNDSDEFDFENIKYNEKLTAEKAVKYLELGGKKVAFTPLEVYEMKQVMQPKIKILGFKPRDSIQPLNYIRAPYFIYPSETRIKNSTVFFRALWQNLLDQNKIAICIFTMRLKSFPRFVALIPQRQDDSITNCFDGFRMEFIPFSGDIRNLSDQMCKEKEVSDDVVNTLRSAVSKLVVDYEPSMFKNPTIATIYNKVEKIEFDEDDEEALADNTLPQTHAQDEIIGPYVAKLSEIFDGFDENIKRKAAQSGGGATKKAAVDLNPELILELCKKRDTKNITVAMLKEYLKSKNVTGGLSSLKKDDLIAKVLKTE